MGLQTTSSNDYVNGLSRYIAMLEENSPQGTLLVFGSAYNTEVRDDDMVSDDISIYCSSILCF